MILVTVNKVTRIIAMIGRKIVPARRESRAITEIPATSRVTVELSSSDIELASHIATVRMNDAKQNHRKAKGLGTYETHFLGAMGEISVSKWTGVDLDDDHSYKADMRRGYDVAGYQVRCTGTAPYDLGLHIGDSGIFIQAMVKDIQQPIVYLTGWIEVDNIQVGDHCSHVGCNNGYLSLYVPQWYLSPLSILPVTDEMTALKYNRVKIS